MRYDENRSAEVGDSEPNPNPIPEPRLAVNTPEPDFESALRTLETVVDNLERGDSGLAEALAKYEQGVRLLALCHGTLDKAERSVALLTGVDGEGNLTTTPFDDAATVATPSEPAPTAVKSNPAPTSRRKRRVEPADDDQDGLIPF